MRRAALTGVGVCAAVAAAVPTLGVGLAHACSCAGRTDAQLPRGANAGATIHQQQVISGSNEASCGLSLQGGGPFVVFANRVDPNNPSDAEPSMSPILFSTGLCNGTRKLAAGEKLPFGRGRAPAAAPSAEPSVEIPDTLGPTTDDEDDDGLGGGAAAGLGIAAAALVAGGFVLRRYGRN